MHKPKLQIQPRGRVDLDGTRDTINQQPSEDWNYSAFPAHSKFNLDCAVIICDGANMVQKVVLSC